MKKFLLLLFALVTTMGAWADETVTIIDNAAGGVWPNGSYSSDNGTSTWKGSWTSTSTTPQITVAANTYLLQNSTGYIDSSSSKTGNYTIGINLGYLITGYEIVFENVNTDGLHNQTITPNGGSGQTAVGTGSATVTVTGLTTQQASFTLTGENTFAKVTKFTVSYVSDRYIWSSGVASSEVGGSSNYYSTTWYLKLTSPNYDDVFFDTFTLGLASDGAADYDGTTYLAFTYDKFASQNNHNANEFIAISSNSLSGHSSATATIKEFTFADKVRMNANTTVYACFVSRNDDGTYNLQKRGLAVKNTGASSGLTFCADNNYTTTESSGGNYQCHYTCIYSRDYDYPQASQDNYRIWSGLNYADRTSDGKISISYMKYTAPGTSDKIVQFNQFSLSMRDADVAANTYLLFSKECLTGTGVTTTTDFAPSHFTAISSNCVPSANYGKVFTFTFDSDQFLHGGQTYYIYMGTKTGDKFNLRKYGIFINHQTSNTGFQYSSSLETATATTNDEWQAIYYSSRCSFIDPTSLLSDVYTFVKLYSGTSLGQYTSDSYTQEQVATALENAETATNGATKFTSYLTLRDIKGTLTNLNLPARNTFLRIKGFATNKYAKAGTITAENVNADNDPSSKIPNSLNKETDGSDIWYYDNTSHLINYKNGLGTVATRAFAALSKTKETTTFSESTCTASDAHKIGVYQIASNFSGSKIWYSNTDNVDRNSANNHKNCEWTLEEVTSLPVTISSVGYASFNSPVAVEIPEGVTAFVLSSASESSLSLTSIDDGIIPANTAVVLKGAAGTYNFNITSEAGTATSAFSGTIAAISVESGKNYTLQNGTYGVAFYILNSTSIPGFKAYYPKPVSGVKALTFVFDTETGIDTRILEQTGEKVYDLQGRLVEKAGKGIYIVNGKKVFVK